MLRQDLALQPKTGGILRHSCARVEWHWHSCGFSLAHGHQVLEQHGWGCVLDGGLVVLLLVCGCPWITFLSMDKGFADGLWKHRAGNDQYVLLDKKVRFWFCLFSVVEKGAGGGGQ